jgi:hypothetical protein
MAGPSRKDEGIAEHFSGAVDTPHLPMAFAPLAQ